MVIKEMKTIFEQSTDENSIFNIKNILKPLTEEELNIIMLEDNALKEKEETAINNQMKRFKKEQEKVINLKTLKKPK
jgi:predicted amino acid-binding ACT domain protein